MRTLLVQFLKILLISSFTSFSFADLSTSINHLVKQQNAHETIGVYIENLATGTVLYNHNGTRPMTPASTTKAFTAAAAYLSLGPNYHYATTLSTNAKIAPILKGNVYLRFSGDPTLTNIDINNLIRQLRAKGVHTITGNFVLDETVFSGPAYAQGWNATDFENCYGAPITGAIINSNCSRFGVVKSPTVYAKEIVRIALKNSGIHVRGQITIGRMPAHTIMLAAHNSGPLLAILNYMLKYSDDVYANAIFKKLGNHYYHSGSYANGALATHAILAAHFGKSFPMPLLKDGSGLSTQNLISPQQLVALYRHMYYNNRLRLAFMKSLAISGQSGTLIYRLTEPHLRGHVYAKTGTFVYDKGGVSNLAGYLMLPARPPIAFAVMVNHTGTDLARAEALQDQIVRLIAAEEIAT